MHMLSIYHGHHVEDMTSKSDNKKKSMQNTMTASTAQIANGGGCGPPATIISRGRHRSSCLVAILIAAAATLLMSSPPVAVAVDLHDLCPTNYTGFTVSNDCTHITWCTNGSVDFQTSCGYGHIYDAEVMTCRSIVHYTCPGPETGAPSAKPTFLPTRTPSKPPTIIPAFDAPTMTPEAESFKDSTDDFDVTEPDGLNDDPSTSPKQSTLLLPKHTYPPPQTVMIEGSKFEIAMSGVSSYLFMNAFSELNGVLDGMVFSNFHLSGLGLVLDAKFSTILLSQGVRSKAFQDGRVEVSPLTNMRFYPESSTIVSRPKTMYQYEELTDISGDYDDDFLRDRRRRRLEDYDSKILEDEEVEGSEEDERELQQVGKPTLFAVMQKNLYLTVQVTDSGTYDESVIPSAGELDKAVASVMRDKTQKALFASWLQASDVEEFHFLQQVDFIGFVNDYWTQPDKHHKDVIMSLEKLTSTTDFPIGGSPPKKR